MSLPKGWQRSIAERVNKGLCISCGNHKAKRPDGKKPILKHLCPACETRIINNVFKQLNESENKSRK